MTYRRYRNRRQSDPLSLFKRALQWAYYKGGLPLVFIIFGIILIGAFSLFSFGGTYNWPVLGIGVLFIAGGLCIKYYKKEDKIKK